MSWSLSYTVEQQDQVEEKGKEVADEYFASFGNLDDPAAQHYGLKEAIDQCARALQAVGLIAPMVGGRGLHVIISGHANTGHQPHQGYSDEMVTVRVNETPLPVPPGEDPA